MKFDENQSTYEYSGLFTVSCGSGAVAVDVCRPFMALNLHNYSSNQGLDLKWLSLVSLFRYLRMRRIFVPLGHSKKVSCRIIFGNPYTRAFFILFFIEIYNFFVDCRKVNPKKLYWRCHGAVRRLIRRMQIFYYEKLQEISHTLNITPK